MAVKIRLKRIGAKKNPFYRVVVADSRNARDGRFIEELGSYNPHTDPSTVKIDVEKAQSWLEKGAQPLRLSARSLSVRVCLAVPLMQPLQSRSLKSLPPKSRPKWVQMHRLLPRRRPPKLKPRLPITRKHQHNNAKTGSWTEAGSVSL